MKWSQSAAIYYTEGSRAHTHGLLENSRTKNNSQWIHTIAVTKLVLTTHEGSHATALENNQKNCWYCLSKHKHVSNMYRFRGNADEDTNVDNR